MPLFIYGDFLRLIIAMSLVGLIQVIMMASYAALMADLVPREHRGKVSGSSGFFKLIAMSIGQLVGGFVYDRVFHQMPWWLQYALVLPSFLLILIFVWEPKRDSEVQGG